MRRVEHGLQAGVARLLELCLDTRTAWFTGIDHAAKLNVKISKSGKRYSPQGQSRRKRGVKQGLPDFLILVKGEPPLGLEIKTSSGSLTPEQRELRASWQRLGIRYRVARSLDEAQGILLQEHVPLLRRMLIGAQ